MKQLAKRLYRIARSAKHMYDRITFPLFYRMSSLLSVLSGSRRRSRRFLRSLKGKYAGKRCFVIGNGPSLTVQDLEMLNGEVTFASNRIYNIFPQTSWRPTYYAVFDDAIAADRDTVAHANQFECAGKFFREQSWLKSRKYKNACFIHSKYERKYLNDPAFSTDVSKEIYTIATVTYSLIQIARHMGFDEIYLLGVDHKYAREQKVDGTVVEHQDTRSYFGNQQKQEKSVVAASWEMEIAYQYAERYSREHNFRIYNATRGGYLEVFERINLDSLFRS